MYLFVVLLFLVPMAEVLEDGEALTQMVGWRLLSLQRTKELIMTNGDNLMETGLELD